MNLLDFINNTYLNLSNINGFNVNKVMLTEPCSSYEVEELEKKFGVELPKQLKEIYINCSSSIQFNWNVDDARFGINCKRGFVNLFSPKEIMRRYDDMMHMVEEGKLNTDELNENEGLRALVNDWPNWIPIFSFPNGDYFCICKNDNTIVLLEHDVMDGGPNVHGLKLAGDFNDLIDKWSKVVFVDIYDWTNGTNDDGIDLNADVFKELLEVL